MLTAKKSDESLADMGYAVFHFFLKQTKLLTSVDKPEKVWTKRGVKFYGAVAKLDFPLSDSTRDGVIFKCSIRFDICGKYVHTLC